MIVGVGIDVCNIARFSAALDRSPRLREKLFTPHERPLKAESLAARFAAKEALAKSLGAPGNLSWQDAEVYRERGKPPQLRVTGTVAARAEALGVASFQVSLSHDDPVATAIVLALAAPVHNG